MRTPRRLAALATTALLLTGAAGCGDDDEPAETGDETGVDDGTDGTDDGDTGDGDTGDPETVAVELADYEFVGLPGTAPVGTTFTVTNRSETELHELVAFALPADEERSAEEILGLPQEELEALFSGEPTMVLLSPPSSDQQIAAVGDGTIAEAGRYLVLCAIPTGADPAEYLAAAAESTDGPPEVEGGPPHFLAGMFAEITIE